MSVAGVEPVWDGPHRSMTILSAVGEDEKWLDWFSSKALQCLTPVGPSVVTAEEVVDLNDLYIEMRHSGKVIQDEDTA